MRNIWLYLPILIVPFVVLAALLRWRSSGVQRDSRWNGMYLVALVLAIIAALIAYGQIRQLLTIPEGFQTSHKDTLFFEILSLLYASGGFLGIAVLSFPKKPIASDDSLQGV